MRIDMTFAGPISAEQAERNRRHVESLGLPRPQKKERPPLAVVGGGPSLSSHLEEIRAWQGDVWIACGAFPWCHENGIEGTFFNIDVQTAAAKYAKGAKRGLVSTHNDPAVFEVLKDADVEVFDLYTSRTGGNHGATTVTAAPVLAMEIGHPSVTFFGCDSSALEKSHAYMDLPFTSWLRVRCDGEEFDTSLPLLAQALCLAEIVRAAPERFICRSEGLLAALVCDFDYDLVATTRGIYEQLTTPDGRPLQETHPLRPYKGEQRA